MKVLFLDDEQWRHDGMDLMLIGTKHVLHHVYNGAEFSHAIDTDSFDLVCFDYDHGPTKGGLHAAADFVAADHRETLCLVHSWNPAGAQAICKLLRRAGHRVIVAPFSTALKGMLEAL